MISSITACLVRARDFLDVIYDKDLYGSLRFFQLKSKLLLKRREKVRARIVRDVHVRCIVPGADRSRGTAVRRPCENEVIFPLQFSRVGNRFIDLFLQQPDEIVH